jgi:hypothetical protein
MTTNKTGFKLQKSIAAILAAALCLESAAFAAPFTTAASDAAAVGRMPVSAAVAVIEDRYELPGALRVILIQDAHTNESSQFNTARALEAIMAHQPIRTVYVEAGTGDDSLDFLKDASDPLTRRAIAERLVRKGLLQGVEFAQLTADHSFGIWGVEDPRLYDRALEAYRAVSSDRQPLLHYLDQIDVTIRFIKERTYSPQLFELDTARSAFEGQAITPAAYLSVLERVARANGMRSEMPIAASALSSLLRREKSLNLDLVTEQMRLAAADPAAHPESIRTLSRIDPSRPAALADLAQAFQATSAEDRIAFRRRYPHLTAYFRYLKAASVLDGSGALEAIHQLEEDLYHRLAQPREHKVMQVAAAAEIFRSLALLTSSPADDQTLRRLEGEEWSLETLTGRVNRLLIDMGEGEERIIYLRPDLERILKSAREFYDLTLERDEAFVRNLLTRMRSSGEREAILVSGGYHAPNLKKMFKEMGISFISMIPQVTHSTDLVRYERLLLSQPGGSRTDAPGPGSFASTLNLRPAAESGSRLAVIARELTGSSSGLPVRNVSGNDLNVDEPAAARMASPPGFEESTPNIDSEMEEGKNGRVNTTLVSARIQMTRQQAARGQLYLRYGFGTKDTDWTWARADLVPVDEGQGLYEARTRVHAWPVGRAVTYTGTYVYIPRTADFGKALGAHPQEHGVIWQSPDLGGNFQVTMGLLKTDVDAQVNTVPTTLDALKLDGVVSLRSLVAGYSNQYLLALDAALSNLIDLRTTSPRVRMRAQMFRFHLHDRDKNYLNLPPTWWALEKAEDADGMWKKMQSEQAEHQITAAAGHLRPLLPQRSRMVRGKTFRRQGTARVDLTHGNASDLAPRNSPLDGQIVINVPVRFKDYDGRETPAFEIAIDNRPNTSLRQRVLNLFRALSGKKSDISPATIRVELNYYDIGRKGSDGIAYKRLRTMTHVYPLEAAAPADKDPNKIPHSEDDRFVLYPFGVVSLFSRMIGQTPAQMIGDGRVLHVRIDTHIPLKSSMSGSIKLASTLMQALTAMYRGRGEEDRLTDANYAFLGVLTENYLGQLGGFQDGINEPGVRILEVPAGEPYHDIRNRFTAEAMSRLDAQGQERRRARAKELMDILDENGVLYFEGQHDSDTTLRDVLEGYLNGDVRYMAQMDAALADAREFADLFDGYDPITLEEVAHYINRQRLQFQAIAPDYVTPKTEQAIEELIAEGLVIGVKPMGAGAGGFVLYLLSDPAHRSTVNDRLKKIYGRGYENGFKTDRGSPAAARMSVQGAVLGRQYAARYLLSPDVPAANPGRVSGSSASPAGSIEPIAASGGRRLGEGRSSWTPKEVISIRRGLASPNRPFFEGIPAGRNEGTQPFAVDAAGIPALARGSIPATIILEKRRTHHGPRLYLRNPVSGAPNAARPLLTLQTRSAAARMSTHNSVFGPAEASHSGVSRRAVQPSTPAMTTEAVVKARRDVDETLDPAKDSSRLHGAVLDLTMFNGLSNRAYSAMIPMMVAAARRAQTRVGGNAIVRVTGSQAERERFFRLAGDKADGLFIGDEPVSVQERYDGVVFTHIGLPPALDAAKPKRSLPVKPFVSSEDVSDEVSLPAFEVWFDAAFFLSTPDPSQERLLEFFKRRSNFRDIQLADVQRLLNGDLDLSLLIRLALPPLVRVPLADIVRAAATAARMSERSA